MSKEVYEILLMFVKRTREDYYSKFESILDSLDFDEEIKEEFTTILENK